MASATIATPRSRFHTNGGRAGLLTSLLTTCLVACGGGGGGGPALPPLTLELATFVGAGPSPAPGDELRLLLSRDVVLVPGAVLDGQDLTLSSGGTLGSVGAVPSLISPRLVSLTLGSGVSFVPDTTTVAFRAGNDAVRAADGAKPGAVKRVISAGDGDEPTITGLTLNAIDDALNGTGPAGGTLQVPRSGFHIDVSHSDPSSSIDVAETVIAADVQVSTGGGALVASQSLTGSLQTSGGGGSSRFSVPAGVTFPAGAVTLTAFAVDVTGMVSAPSTFTFRVRAVDNAVRPFETAQLWYLDLSRDVESYVHDPFDPDPVRIVLDGGGAPIPNGRPDLDDLFYVLGLLGSNSSVNTTVSSQFQQQLQADLDALFAGADVSFTFTSPGSFPGSPTVPYGSLSFSQMCIAGAEDETGTSGILGAAIFDVHNTTQDNDCLLALGGTQRLGVFAHTMVNAGLRPPSSSMFRVTYDPLVPVLGGVPIGDEPDGLDAGRLAGTVVDARATTITTAIDRMARALSVITAHECGHSMGLVRDGKMPGGLYGNDVTFVGSAPGHIRTTSLFPPGADNVMSPTLDFDVAIAPGTAFNSLNQAYLLEQAVHNE